VKRDDLNIDEILRRLPHAPQEEVDAAGETVLKRILEMRFQGEPEASAATEPKKTPNADWMHDFHVALLMAVVELHGYGDPVRITLRMQEILEEPIVWGTAVFLNLLLMEKMGLVSSSPIDSEKPQESDQRYFAISESGREVLANALTARDRAAERVRRPRFA
jgi:hypothetical protein